MTHLSWKVKIFQIFSIHIHKTSNLIVDGHPSSTGIPPAVNLKLLEDAISRWDIFRDMWECIWDWYIGYQKTRRISASPSWTIHHLMYQISEQRPVMMPSVSPIPPHMAIARCAFKASSSRIPSFPSDYIWGLECRIFVPENQKFTKLAFWVSPGFEK